jgi:hypothetical protein
MTHSQVDRLAHRIARRHLHHAAVVSRPLPPEVIDLGYTAGSGVLATDLERSINVTGLQFRPAWGGANAVSWQAVDERGEVLTGSTSRRRGPSPT